MSPSVGTAQGRTKSGRGAQALRQVIATQTGLLLSCAHFAEAGQQQGHWEKQQPGPCLDRLNPHRPDAHLTFQPSPHRGQRGLRKGRWLRQ